MIENKAQELLKDFSEYLLSHPEQRFWQALRNWAEVPYVMAGDLTDPQHKINTLADTFYWEGRNS